MTEPLGDIRIGKVEKQFFEKLPREGMKFHTLLSNLTKEMKAHTGKALKQRDFFSRLKIRREEASGGNGAILVAELTPKH